MKENFDCTQFITFDAFSIVGPLAVGLNSALRKVTNGKAAFPSDSSAMKALFLRTLDLLNKWTQPVPGWAKVLNQLFVIFGNRISNFVS